MQKFELEYLNQGKGEMYFLPLGSAARGKHATQSLWHHAGPAHLTANDSANNTLRPQEGAWSQRATQLVASGSKGQIRME